MSTQQQLNAWNAALAQKEQERADQAFILKVQQEELAKAERARINAALEVQKAIARRAPDAEIRALIQQQDRFEDEEVSARIAASKTEDNIAKLDGSIRYNRTQRDLYQGALPAQGTPASTVADQSANIRSNAAETAPAPQPQSNRASSVSPSQQNNQNDFVIDDNGEFVPSDSSRADEIRASQNRVQTNVPQPVSRSAIEEGGEAEAQAALAARRQAAEPVPPNVTVIQDENGTWGVWNDDEGRFIVQGLSQQEAQLQADEIAAGFGVQQRPFPPGALVTAPSPVPTGEWTAVLNSDGSGPGDIGTWYITNENGEIYQSGITDGNEARIIAENLSLGSTEPLPQGTAGGTGLTPEEQAAKEQAAAKARAINQATLQSRYKQAGSSDWRVRLQLAPTSDYLYNANPPGILKPLAATNGVIFPYTPQINTSYKANYEQYDLVHSNYRGVYYKNSRVDDINIRAIFTAQDTREADYLLAVIHFFRSVTKMFYGKDAQRGSPPPLVYLSGLGMNQFYGHPCVVSNFIYNLPDNVDYIRATNYNNYGTDLLSRRTASKSSPVAGLGATGNRILNAGLERFFPANKPTPDTVVASVNNTQLANYVPTKMEIDITLIPVQTRSQVSKQFSLKGFANGDLIKGGFW
jgi:hypothetical protein